MPAPSFHWMSCDIIATSQGIRAFRLFRMLISTVPNVGRSVHTSDGVAARFTSAWTCMIIANSVLLKARSLKAKQLRCLPQVSSG